MILAQSILPALDSEGVSGGLLFQVEVLLSLLPTANQ